MAFDLATCVFKQTRIQATEPNVAEVITGEKRPTMNEIHNAAQSLQISAVNFVKEHSKNSRFEKYKKEIEKCSAEIDKKIDCLTLNAEEKEVIRSLAVNMNNLKFLKATRSKLNASFCEALTKIVSNDSYSIDEVKTMKNNFKNMNAIGSEIKETKEHCLAVINTSNKLNNLFSKVLLQNESISSTAPPFDMPHKIHTLISKVRSDNDSLKITLAGTNQKLGEILNVTENISQTVQELYGQFMEVPKLHNELCAMKSKLEEQQKLMKRVEGERNEMKSRLDVLDALILEEQAFLDSFGKTNPVPNEKLRSLKVMENCNGFISKV